MLQAINISTIQQIWRKYYFRKDFSCEVISNIYIGEERTAEQGIVTGGSYRVLRRVSECEWVGGGPGCEADSHWAPSSQSSLVQSSVVMIQTD